jgi:hypothetical protein
MSKSRESTRNGSKDLHAVQFHRNRLVPTALAVAVALACGQAAAETTKWTGTNTGNGNLNKWSSGQNWDKGVPGINDTAVINGGINIPTLSRSVTIGTLQYRKIPTGGSLNLAGNTITIAKDYDSNFFLDSNNIFDRYRNVTTNGGAINASTTSGTNSDASTFQQLSVNGGATKTAATSGTTLALGNIHVGKSVSKDYFIYDMAGDEGVMLRGAVQAAGITSSLLSGNGVENSAWTALNSGAGIKRTVTFTGTTAGALSSQQLTILNNFGNTNEQVLSITGAAYDYAKANIISTPINLGNVHVGGSFGTSALSIQNTAASGSFTEGLNASFGAATNGATGIGTLINLAGGATNNTSLVVGLGGSANTGTAGAKSGTVAVSLASNGTISGLANTALTGQTVSVTGGVYSLAAGSATPTPVTIAAQRIGGTTTSALTVTNTSAATGGYTERLDATFGSNSNSDVRNNGGAVNLLGAGGSSTAMSVGVNTSTAGAKSGSVVLNYTSNGTGTSGLGNTSAGTQTIQVSGNVYQSAAASTSPVSFGIVHIGDSVSKGIVTNSAPVANLNDTLQGTVGVSGAGFTGGGTFSGAAAGSTASTAQVTLNTSNAGSYSGTATLTNLASHNSEMTNLGLADQSIALTGQVNNYAKASLGKDSGAGTFSGSGSSYVLDFGNITRGSGSTSASLSVLNSGGSASFTDMLTGTFITTGASPFTFNGLSSVTDLTGGSTQGFQISLSNAQVNTFNQNLTFNYRGFNSGYSDPTLGTITLALRGNIISPVPEPTTWAMLIGGLVVVSLRARKMKARETNLIT